MILALERVVERVFYPERLLRRSRLALVFAQGTALVDHPTRFAGLPFSGAAPDRGVVRLAALIEGDPQCHLLF